jgi:predicted alpha/beta superfamily hydrolase
VALSNAYLQFIFEELKPMIDSQYATKADMKSTFMMGANLGGLISLSALCKYPDQLKGIAGIAMQWPSIFQEKK